MSDLRQSSKIIRVARRLSPAGSSRYIQATIGPVGGAISQFLLSIQLLNTLTIREFGLYSFLMVIAQFLIGVWSALFCAPMPIILAESNKDHSSYDVDALFVLNIILSFLVFAFIALLGPAIGLSIGESVLFAAFAVSSVFRSLARAFAYSTSVPLKTITSDIIFSFLVVLQTFYIYVWGASDLLEPFFILLSSSLIALMPFGLKFFARQFRSVRFNDVLQYHPIWIKHSRWALTGVITTEATANAHSYIVTIASGPGSFAVIAASSLLVRPIGVIMNALSEFERPSMSRSISVGDNKFALRALNMFLGYVLSLWFLNLCLAIILLLYFIDYVFPDNYDRHQLILTASLWFGVVLIRSLRMPPSTLLQAAGVFRPLAIASIYSTVISIPSVVACLVMLGPLWSIAGVLFGEAVYAIFIIIAFVKWRSQNLKK